MEMNAHIHNRLTHSLEVASLGRSFARRLAKFLHERSELPCRCRENCQQVSRQCPQASDDLTHSLMAACLVHDIGNPPFGHAGEFSIREWSERHVAEVFPMTGEIKASKTTCRFLKAMLKVFAWPRERTCRQRATSEPPIRRWGRW